MALQSAHASPSSLPDGSPRRRLADNVVCLFPEDRSPVVQTAGRRGRYPAKVSRLESVPRLRVGAICEVLNCQPLENVGLIVRLLDVNARNEWGIETVDGRTIKFPDGSTNRRGYIHADALRRTFWGESHG